MALGVARYQLGMAREGYFVRGGLAFNALFMDNNVVYGAALLEAYELEHAIAKDPRVVASDTVVQLLREQFSYYAQPESAPQNDVFLLDSDGRVFLNYLDPCFEDVPDGLPADTATLLRHKAHIEKGLKDFARNPRVWAKYAWLATYHDFVINHWRRRAGLAGNLTINARLHRVGPVQLSPFLFRRRVARRPRVPSKPKRSVSTIRAGARDRSAAPRPLPRPPAAA